MQSEARLRDVARTQHGCFSRKQALACGVTRRQIDHRVAARRWLILLPRVFVVNGLPVSWRGWVMAGCLRAAPGASAAGSTAARLWELLPESSGPIEVATTRNIRRKDPASSDLPVHHFHRVGRLPKEQIIVVDGIPVTSVERTLLDVAGAAPPWTFNEALDCALRKELTSLERIAHYLDEERRSGVDGVRRLRAAVELRLGETGTSRSVLEREFLELVRTSDLPLPELNQPVEGPDGFLAIVDMIYPDHKVIIEVQSFAHHSSLEAFNNDAERLGTLTALGYRALEVTSDQIRRRPQKTIDRLGMLLRAPVHPQGTLRGRSAPYTGAELAKNQIL
ncbi:MAG: endonuclease domain-containing protein [Actinomycetota bacterium]|nr:endonuclease domain-containing protein [Actinomycetota bacterium]